MTPTWLQTSQDRSLPPVASAAVNSSAAAGVPVSPASPATARPAYQGDNPRTPPTLAERVSCALAGAVDHLLAQQHPEGYWCAELEGDSILESEYILLKHILGQENDPRLPWIANYLRTLQRAEDGAWIQYPGAKPDLSATVKGYFALKLMGDKAQAPHMQKARDLIRRLGGAERCNTYTKFYLAALGQISYEAVPSIPPEIVFLPKWFYFHLDKVSAWSRTMITPLSIVVSHRPVRKIAPELGIDELYLCQETRQKVISLGQNQTKHERTWTTVFLSIDRLLKLVDRAGMTPLRRRALDRLEEWIVDHTDRSDGLGAIFPPMVYILIALRCRGYKEDHPVIRAAHKHLDDLMIVDHEKQQIRIQPCFSPIWDTGIAAYAMTEAGLDLAHPAMRRCAQWLLSKECRQPGDWVANVREPVEPSGWYFEFNNGYYPDVDDTAMVAMALRRIGGDEALAAGRRGVRWMLAMQNEDGGWAAFDREAHNRSLYEFVPFADHNAMQDPSCPDITGRTLECLGHHGFLPDDPAIAKAIQFIRSKQEHDGCWFGRWGVNYIYGTWQVVCGLRKVGYDMQADWVQKAGQWLLDHQQADGAFGESADTYEDPSRRGQGPATASQTAWGTMALMAIYGPDHPAVHKGIAWLVETQNSAGTWEEPWFTGTGFPKVFYLRYHLYRHYFPLMCLGRWLKTGGHR